MTVVHGPSRVGEAKAQSEVLRVAAIKRLKKKRAFWGHLFAYLVVNAALWTIWAIDGTTDGFVWPWPAIVSFFWGLFVLGDAYEAFWKTPISEQEIEREVARLSGSASFVALDTDDD
jgi:hypothetical protein